ncbi:hypothetical protein AV656_11440 [Bhargavaea cecembensis]|uniref:ATPase n=1 Tax=Bhargavaea cecembensis TaxID=394098 RepID=A0A163EU32_9BACL|nr:hypothetical protein [Bhargavaea cecembensis]KZE37186.1 hypothetical protein AV656_11440 [Bhargavaea cecembensis]
MSVTFLVINLVAVFLVSAMMAYIFRGSEKVDQGPEFFYAKLTYRRKMIRTLTLLPIFILFMIAAYYFFEWREEPSTHFGLFLLTLPLIQFFYEYYMWRKHEYEKKS